MIEEGKYLNCIRGYPATFSGGEFTLENGYCLLVFEFNPSDIVPGVAYTPALALDSSDPSGIIYADPIVATSIVGPEEVIANMPESGIVGETMTFTVTYVFQEGHDYDDTWYGWDITIDGDSTSDVTYVEEIAEDGRSVTYTFTLTPDMDGELVVSTYDYVIGEWMVVGKTMIEEAAPFNPIPDGAFLFTDSLGQGDIYLYAWNGEGEEEIAAFPGVLITDEDHEIGYNEYGQMLYYFMLDVTKYDHFLVVLETEGGFVQTQDYAIDDFQGAAGFYLVFDEGKLVVRSWANAPVEVEEPAPAPNN